MDPIEQLKKETTEIKLIRNFKIEKDWTLFIRKKTDEYNIIIYIPYQWNPKTISTEEGIFEIDEEETKKRNPTKTPKTLKRKVFIEIEIRTTINKNVINQKISGIRLIDRENSKFPYWEHYHGRESSDFYDCLGDLNPDTYNIKTELPKLVEDLKSIYQNIDKKSQIAGNRKLIPLASEIVFKGEKISIWTTNKNYECINCGFASNNEEQFIEIDGDNYCLSCAGFCPNCGEPFIYEEGIFIESDDITVCKFCYEEHYSYCPYCEKYYHNSEMRWIDSIGEDVCENCLNDYFEKCDECEDYYKNEDIKCIDTPDGEIYICSHCFDNYQQCDVCDLYIRESANLIKIDTTLGTKYVCQECAEQFGKCDICHLEYPLEDLTETKDGFYCEDCLSELEKCDECGNHYKNENIEYIDTLDGEIHICPNCLNNYQQCDICELYTDKPLKQIETTNGIVNVCQNCITQFEKCNGCQLYVFSDDLTEIEDGLYCENCLPELEEKEEGNNEN